MYVSSARNYALAGPGQNYFSGSGALKERSEPWLPAIKKSSRARKQFPLPAPAAVARTGKTLNLYYYVLAVSALCPNAFLLSACGITVLCVARLLLGEAVRVFALAAKISPLQRSLCVDLIMEVSLLNTLSHSSLTLRICMASEEHATF